MAALELEGTIKAKLAVQSGTSARGGWARQDFVVEYQDGNFPSDACITAWGEDKVRDIQRFQVGDAVKVSFNVRAREYQGRWFNDLRLWRIAPAGAAPAAPGAASFGPTSTPADIVPPPTLDDQPADSGEDDLPF